MIDGNLPKYLFVNHTSLSQPVCARSATKFTNQHRMKPTASTGYI